MRIFKVKINLKVRLWFCQEYRDEKEISGDLRDAGVSEDEPISP